MTAPLHQARRADSERKRQAAHDAIDHLTAEGAVVNFETVRRRAGVSRSLLYTDTDLKNRITENRGSSGTDDPSARSTVSEQSLRNDLALAEHDNRQLRVEIEKLRRRLSTTIAAELDATVGGINPTIVSDLEEQVARLQDELADSRQRILELEADHAELTESLGASRDNYRRLMALTNRADTSG